MRTVVLGPPPAEIDALIARRHALGLDSHDEVWKGEYHMAPAAHPSHGKLDQQLAELLGPMARRADLFALGEFNLGTPDDFRVPDRGMHRVNPTTTFLSTAAIVIEILSPHDESWEKLDFYAARGVDEVLIASPADRSVTWLQLRDGRYLLTEHSRLLGPESADLADQINWQIVIPEQPE
jgi:Uma2 family endonuclease